MWKLLTSRSKFCVTLQPNVASRKLSNTKNYDKTVNWNGFKKHALLCVEAEECSWSCKIGCIYWDPAYETDFAKKMEREGHLHLLATLYLYGEAVEKDVNKAFELFQKSAEQGNAKAQNDLGFLYCQDGDLKKAEELFKSAAKGDEIAKQNLERLESINIKNYRRILTDI